jgi:hypothetical protein
MAREELDLEALYERARGADIEAVAGVKLWRAGRRLRGPCPVCGASKGKRAEGAFSIDPQARIFICFAGAGDCAQGGDVIRLEQLLRHGTLREAAERLAGPAPPAATPARPEPRPARAAPAAAPASDTPLRLWRESRAAAGTPVEAYLAARGIAGAVLAGAVRQLRFHPEAYFEWDGGRRRWITAPGMVARVVAPSGPTGGVHVTYLRRDRPERDRRLGKRMFGPQADAEGRPGGAWLVPQASAPGAPLVTGEGIETALSAAQLLGRPARVAAALSLNRLQGGWLPDRFGRYDVEAPRMDPERPAFTWPSPADDPWPEVLVAIDRDMAAVSVKVRALAGKTVRRRLGPEERARVCASLAVQHWRAAGAPKVRPIAPPAGADFNDQLRGGAG